MGGPGKFRGKPELGTVKPLRKMDDDTGYGYALPSYGYAPDLWQDVEALVRMVQSRCNYPSRTRALTDTST